MNEQAKFLEDYIKHSTRYTPFMNVIYKDGRKNWKALADALRPIILETYGQIPRKKVDLEDSFIILALTTYEPKDLDPHLAGISHKKFGEGRTRSYFTEKFGIHIDNRGSSLELREPATIESMIDAVSELFKIKNPNADKFFKYKFK